MTDVVSEILVDDISHLKAETRVLDLMIAREIHRNRNGSSSELGDGLEGLVVSDGQIDSILSSLNGLGEESDEMEDPFRDLIERERLQLHERKAESIMAGVPLRLEALKNEFRLNPFETGVIVVCMAPEIDLKYETLFSYLQDDVGRKRPTVNLPLTLLCSTLAERVSERKSFIYPSPLIKGELLELVDDPYSKESSFLSRSLKIDPRVVEYLLGSDAPDAALKSIMQVFTTDVDWEHLILPEHLKSRLQRLPQNLQSKTSEGVRVILQLVGSAGVGKKSIAKALCDELGAGLLVVNCLNLIASEQAPDSLIGLVIRESLLQNATIYLDNFHTLFEDNPRSHTVRMALTEAIAGHDRLIVVAGETTWRPDSEFDEHMLINIEIPPPGFPERKQLWATNLNGHGGGLSEDGIASIAGKFRLNGGQIRRAVTTATHNAWWRSNDFEEPSVEDLEAASRWHSNQRLSLLAKKIQPRYLWDDIVLPQDQKFQLREICGYFANIPIVYGQWGFQSKTSLGKGLNILFAGPSGTGKTMSAEVMATELGLDVYKIDLAGVISKYIGETEKNLDKIFKEAQDSNAILFFDEADSLFGKRSEVRDSHDRYANIEISYLLQKMEEYQGIVILATNFRKNMDDAFVRRMHFAVEFPFPEEEYRLEIWERVFPEIAPLDDSVDLGFIARQFKLAGGNIKNIAVGAAFLAAEQKDSIRMEHVMWATKREHQKMGKLISEGDFGPYFKIVNR